jgi:hypothetical protein
MRKQIIETAAFEVATQVRAVEDSIDSTLAEIAELQARILRANSVAGVGVAAANPTIEHLLATMTGIVSARGAIAGCHAALVDAKAGVPGLRTVSFGDVDKCPDAATTGAVPLRVVA